MARGRQQRAHEQRIPREVFEANEAQRQDDQGLGQGNHPPFHNLHVQACPRV